MVCFNNTFSFHTNKDTVFVNCQINDSGGEKESLSLREQVITGEKWTELFLRELRGVKLIVKGLRAYFSTLYRPLSMSNRLSRIGDELYTQSYKGALKNT